MILEIDSIVESLIFNKDSFFRSFPRCSCLYTRSSRDIHLNQRWKSMIWNHAIPGDLNVPGKLKSSLTPTRYVYGIEPRRSLRVLLEVVREVKMLEALVRNRADVWLNEKLSTDVETLVCFASSLLSRFRFVILYHTWENSLVVITKRTQTKIGKRQFTTSSRAIINTFNVLSYTRTKL